MFTCSYSACLHGVAIVQNVTNVGPFQSLIIHLTPSCRILYQVSPLYIAELSPKELRGRLISFIAIASVFGTLVRKVTS